MLNSTMLLRNKFIILLILLVQFSLEIYPMDTVWKKSILIKSMMKPNSN